MKRHVFNVGDKITVTAGPHVERMKDQEGEVTSAQRNPDKAHDSLTVNFAFRNVTAFLKSTDCSPVKAKKRSTTKV